MNLLVIGGTVFVGRHFVEAALARGHSVTLFHRGSKGTGIIPGAAEILGDRDGQIDRAAGQNWDAVVDCCGYVPRIVRQSVEALASPTTRYLFVSTVSVYESDGQGGLTVKLPDPPIATEEVTGDTYGPLKVECEAVVREGFGERALMVRPGVVAGPYDPTNRFTHWVTRIAGGGEVLVPQATERALQLIDARDLGLFMILLLEQGFGGIVDAVGEPITFGEMIETCRQLNMGTELVWASEAAAAELGISAWTDLPLVLPDSRDEDGMMRISPMPARALGLPHRPLIDTAHDTLAWANSLPPSDAPPRHGLTRERELAALEAVKAKKD